MKIVALIAALFAFLSHPVPPDRPPPVQAGAAAAMAAYYGQPITWTGCRQGSNDELGERLDRAGARCAQVTVPLDYAKPRGRTITIAISRLPATDTKRRIGSLFLNHGGPAEPTLGMPLETRAYLGDLAVRFDLIGIDPRFVGRSVPLDCDWPVGLWVRSAGTDRAAFERQVAFQRSLAQHCVRRHADVLPYVTTRNTARDMDIVRAALGERRVSFLGYSYGAYLGAVYLQLFPGRTDRVVLDSAGDPRRFGARLYQGNEAVTEKALRAWASWAADRHDEYGLGTTRAAVLATVRHVVQAAVTRPLRVGPYVIDEHLAPYLVARGVGNDRDEARAAFATTMTTLKTAAARIAVEPAPELAGQLEFMLTGTYSQYGSAAAAIICGDSAVPRDPVVYWRDIERSRKPHPLFGPIANHIWPCAFWPEPYEPLTQITNDSAALIVSATGDTATTYRGSQAMHRLLTGSRLLTLHAIAHGVYGEYGSPCVDAKVNAYLATGELPTGNVTCRS